MLHFASTSAHPVLCLHLSKLTKMEAVCFQVVRPSVRVCASEAFSDRIAFGFLIKSVVSRIT